MNTVDPKSQLVPPLWLMFLLVGFPQLSETVYSPALPNIALSLGVGDHLVQWTLSIYFLGFAVGVFTWGRLSDSWGRRPSMLLGLVVYIIASMLCLFANGIVALLLARLIQGLGASCGSVLTQTIAREALPDQRRHKFFAAIGFVMAFAIALGPLLGGYLTSCFHWRANFVLLCLIGLFLVVFVYFVLPETRPSNLRVQHKITKVLRLLVKDKQVLGSIWLVAAVNGILFSYYAQGPFIFIRLMHFSASGYGWLGAFIALAALLGSLSARYFIKHYLAVNLIATGCIIMLISSIILLIDILLLNINVQDTWLCVLLIILPMMGIIYGGFGFVIPMTLSTALQKYQSVLGTAGACFGLSYYIVIAFLTWIMGFIHNGTLYPMPIYFLILSGLSLMIYILLIRDA